MWLLRGLVPPAQRGARPQPRPRPRSLGSFGRFFALLRVLALATLPLRALGSLGSLPLFFALFGLRPRPRWADRSHPLAVV